MKKKFFAVFLLIMALMSCLLMPVSAFSGMDPDGDLGARYVDPLGFTSMWFENKAHTVWFDNPVFDTVRFASTYPNNVYFEYWDPNSELDLALNFHINPDTATSAAGFAYVPWIFATEGFSSSTFFDFGFYGTNELRCNFPACYKVCQNYYQFKLPAYCKLTYSCQFNLLVPSRSVASSGAVDYDFEEVSLIVSGHTNTGASVDVWVPFLPPLSRLLSGSGLTESDLSDCIIVSSSWTGHLSYTDRMFPSNYFFEFKTLQHPYSVGSDLSDIAGFASSYSDVRIVNAGDMSEADFVTWLGNSLSAFLSIRLIGEFSLGGLLAVVLSLGLVVALIKIFGH